MRKYEIRYLTLLVLPLFIGAFTRFEKGETVVEGQIAKSGDRYLLITRGGTNSEARIRLTGSIPPQVRDSVGARGALRLHFNEPSRDPATEASVVSVEKWEDPFESPDRN